MLTTRPRGTADILPPASGRWNAVVREFRAVAHAFGYGEIRTPVFEHTELFERGVGDATDIVEKEMYTFTDRGGRRISLRAEGTAPCVRAYLEHGLASGPQPVKFSYVAPIFRYERPQAGRYRQHHQFGIEVLGAAAPSADAEVIALAWEVFTRLGLTGLELNLNSIGCPTCRGAYRARLKQHYRPHLAAVCADCRARFERNTLRLLDCKQAGCQALMGSAPRMGDLLCGECGVHFEGLQDCLRALRIPYAVNPNIVRGLDYYTKTVFEVMHRALGSQNVVCGGGRYDGLAEVLGGAPTPGVGFGMGVERLLQLVEGASCLPAADGPPAVYVVAAGQGMGAEALALAMELRREGLAADCDHLGRSVKAQMKQADRLGAAFAAMLGEDELRGGVVTARKLAGGEQETVPREGLARFIKERLG